MKYQATITFSGDADNIMTLFAAEEKKFKHGRSEYEIKKEGSDVEFTVKADDATALRSTLDSIAKALKIYEDMKNE